MKNRFQMSDLGLLS
jgi:hypothetical protein